MNESKLFRALVVGGAMLAAQCTRVEDPLTVDSQATTGPDGLDAPPEEFGRTDSGPDGEDSGAEAALADAAPSLGADAEAADAATTQTELCFCPRAECCETDDQGSSQVRAGFVCCWSTTC